jgi:hypothetical protein
VFLGEGLIWRSGREASEVAEASVVEAEAKNLQVSVVVEAGAKLSAAAKCIIEKKCLHQSSPKAKKMDVQELGMMCNFNQ